VLVSKATLTRRSATIEVIGAALVAKRAGLGIGASPSGWVPADRPRVAVPVHGPRRAVRAAAAARAYRLDANVGRITSRRSPFDDALEALSVAVGVIRSGAGAARSRWHVMWSRR
jgi:hypothetical protein